MKTLANKGAYCNMEFRKDKIKGVFQHRLNELHLYCRLRKIGMPHFMAKGIAKIISPKKLLYENGKPVCLSLPGRQGRKDYNGSKPNSKQTSQNSKNLLS